MNIVITGARGSLGISVVDAAIAAGHHVLAADLSAPLDRHHTAVEDVVVDLRDYAAARELMSGSDAVIHLAAYSQPNLAPWPEIFGANTTLSYNVLHAAAEEGVGRVTAASSVNALGGVFSRAPHFDYFPLDTDHPSYNEDPYSLSKTVLEEQARSITRRYPGTDIASLRLHSIAELDKRIASYRHHPAQAARDLWGWSPLAESATLFVTTLTGDVRGAEVFYATASHTIADVPSEELRSRYYPEVPVRKELTGRAAFFDSSPARERFGWLA